eukprot:EG_transcript_15192
MHCCVALLGLTVGLEAALLPHPSLRGWPLPARSPWRTPPCPRVLPPRDHRHLVLAAAAPGAHGAAGPDPQRSAAPSLLPAVALTAATLAGALARLRGPRPAAVPCVAMASATGSVAEEPRRHRDRPQKDPPITAKVARTGVRRGGRVAAPSLPSPEVQAVLDTYSISLQKVRRRYPHVTAYGVERVERVMGYLAGLGVDVKRVVEMYPALLGGQVEAYQTVAGVLRDHGLDAAQVVNGFPAVLVRRPAALSLVMEAIACCGHAVADVVRRHPAILRCTPADVAALLRLQAPEVPANEEQFSLEAADSKAMLLSALGLDTHRLLRKAPDVLKLSVEKLLSVVGYLEGLGVDVPKVVWSIPNVFLLRLESLQQRVEFLSQNGL